jgi:spermidine synthase
MILPTLCLGATFPLVSKIYTQKMANIGRSIGFAYSINTIGAVLGSFCAGFVLIPILGKEMSIRWLVFLQLGCALLIAFIVLVKTVKFKLVPLIVPALAGLVLCFYFPQWNRQQLTLGKYHRFSDYENIIENAGWTESLFKGTDLLEHTQQGEIVYYGDGVAGFTAVKRHVNPLEDYYYKLIISGKTDASSHGDMKTQTLSGHFPLLFHPDPKKVMVIGLASGVTAGEALNYPIDQLDVLEISQEVVTASDYFRPWNSDVLSDSRTNLIVQDGRAHLQLTDQIYDVIISEPSNPWMAGLATLFTKDFFELGKEKLNDRGIFVQWLQTYQIDWETVQLIGRTFTDVFPNSILVATEPAGFGADYLLVGFKGDNQISLQNAQQKFPFAQKSKNIILRDPRLFYRLIVAENLKDIFGSGPINSDQQPILEFAAPKLIYHTDMTIQKKIRSEGLLSQGVQETVNKVTSDIESQIDFAEYAFSVNAPFRKMVYLPEATDAQRDRFYQLFEDYVKRDIIDYQLIGDPALRQKCLSIQIKKIEDNIDSMSDKAAEYKFLGELYLKSGKLDESVENYSKSIQFNQDDAETHYNLGIVYAQKALIDQAKESFRKATELSPKYATITPKIIGLALSNQGRFQEAVISLEQYLKMEPDDFRVHDNLGTIYLQTGEVDLAIEHFKEALKINPEFEAAFENLKTAKSLKESQRAPEFE